MAKKAKTRKLGGAALEAKIANSNLEAQKIELDRVVRINSELVNERDFLRKVVLSLSGHAR